jgi:hypothetical protein
VKDFFRNLFEECPAMTISSHMTIYRYGLMTSQSGGACPFGHLPAVLNVEQVVNELQVNGQKASSN